MSPQNVTKIKREQCLLLYTQFPITKNEDEYFFPRSVTDYRLGILACSEDEHNTVLGLSFTQFIQELDIDALVFLGDSDTPWLYRDSDFKPAKEALAYLVAHKLGKRFNGGLKVSIDELPVFLKHIAWLGSTNTVLPIVHFMDPMQRLVGSICHYGNIHLSILDKEIDERVVIAIENVGLRIVEGNNCK